MVSKAVSFICVFFLSIQSFIGNANECPNGQFKIAARYHQQFDLKGLDLGSDDYNKRKRYYVAFGSAGKWVITLVDAIDPSNAEYIKFKCKENYWGSVEPIVSPSTREDALQKYHAPICCVSPYTIDAPLISHSTTTSPKKDYNPFAVLPYTHHQVIAETGSPIKGQHYDVEGVDGENDPNFYWYLYEAKPTSSIVKKMSKRKFKSEHKGFYQFKRWQIMRLSKAEFLASKDMILHKTNAKWDDKEVTKVDNCVDLEECDTGIVSHIVVFQSKCSASEHLETITFAFSTNGIFNLKSLLHCIPESVSYYPMTRLFKLDNQYKPSYNIRKLGSNVDLGWKLGSFCGSCPMTRMRMQISEKEALSNKQRLENALSISGKFDGGFGAGYTRKWVNEAAETLTSGRATTIEARCNGFYLWYWTINVGTWGTGTSVIPTQLFYCTDRQNPPVCKPRISKDDEFLLRTEERLCNGHDVASDFDLEVQEMKAKGPMADSWMSMHDGRPKPVRLQGQKVKLNEPAFVTRREIVQLSSSSTQVDEQKKREIVENTAGNQLLRRSKSLSDADDILHSSRAHASVYGDLYRGGVDKGLFVGSMKFDDDEVAEETVHNMLFYELFMIGIVVLGTIMIVCCICGMFCGYSSHKIRNKWNAKQIDFVLNAL